MKTYLNYEKGYIVFNKLIGTISPNVNFFLFICAAISLIPVALLIYNESSNKLQSIIVYMALPVFFITFSGLRQGIAIAITTLSYRFIKKRKLPLFILLVVFASLFHSSAMIFLTAYPLYHIRFDRAVAVSAFFVLPIIWLFKGPIFAVASRLFKDNATPDDNGAITFFIVFSIVYLFCACFSDRDNQVQNGLSNLFWMSCALQAMGGIYQTVIRVGYYFMIYLCILLPDVLSDFMNIDKENKELYWVISKLIMICFLTFGIYSIRYSTWPESYPYSFFWER